MLVNITKFAAKAIVELEEATEELDRIVEKCNDDAIRETYRVYDKIDAAEKLMGCVLAQQLNIEVKEEP